MNASARSVFSRRETSSFRQAVSCSLKFEEEAIKTAAAIASMSAAAVYAAKEAGRDRIGQDAHVRISMLGEEIEHEQKQESEKAADGDDGARQADPVPDQAASGGQGRSAIAHLKLKAGVDG